MQDNMEDLYERPLLGMDKKYHFIFIAFISFSPFPSACSCHIYRQNVQLMFLLKH